MWFIAEQKAKNRSRRKRAGKNTQLTYRQTCTHGQEKRDKMQRIVQIKVLPQILVFRKKLKD